MSEILGDSFTFEGTYEDFFGIKGKDSNGFLGILLVSKGLFEILKDSFTFEGTFEDFWGIQDEDFKGFFWILQDF